MNTNLGVEGKETISLTEWEAANLHLPPVTTITLYEGDAPVEYLRHRIRRMLEKNPWLLSRIVKKCSAEGKEMMAHATVFDAERVVDQHFSAYGPGEVGLSLGLSYEELFQCLQPLQCARSKPATDKDEVLFKVAIVPVETRAGESDTSRPLQRAIALPGFALVVSTNHTLGDGHTYYLSASLWCPGFADDYQTI